MRSYISALLAAGRARVLSAVLLSIGVACLEGAGLVTLAPVLAVVGAGQVGGGAGLAVRQIAGWGLPSVLALWVAVVSLHALAGALRDRTILRLQQSVADRQREKLFAAAVHMEWRAYTRERNSDLTAALTVAPQRIQLGTGAVLNGSARLCLLIVHMAVAIWLAPLAGAIALLAGLGLAAVRARSLRPALRRGRWAGEAARTLQSQVEDHLAAMKLIKSWGLGSRAERQFHEELTRQASSHQHQQASRIRSDVLSRVSAAAVAAAGIGVAVGGLGLSGISLLVLAAVLARLLPAAGDLVRLAIQGAENLPAWSESEAMLARFSAAAEPDHDETGVALAVEEVILSSISFGWGEGRELVLTDADLTLPAGAITALVGPSGAGKTTLADIALGILSPERGSVRVGGRLLTGPLRTAWRRNSAYVPQETFLFHASIRDNLMWGRADATEDMLWNALASAQADELVRRLPEGLETIVGDRGMRLSGGERQRIALARALLREPAFLVLDEATSALDGESEEKILAALEGLRGRLTILVIAHRLSTVRIADRVLALKDGHLSDRGAPV